MVASVLSIPLAFGDSDLSAAGTVTDVLPDGSVIGFGHAMFGQGAIGLPITNGFIGEFLLLMGIYQYGIWYAAFGGLTIILGAVYLLRMYQKVMLGPANERTEGFKALQWNESAVLAVIAGLVILIGVYPQPLLNISEHAVTELVDTIGVFF